MTSNCNTFLQLWFHTSRGLAEYRNRRGRDRPPPVAAVTAFNLTSQGAPCPSRPICMWHGEQSCSASTAMSSDYRYPAEKELLDRITELDNLIAEAVRRRAREPQSSRRPC
jgi:hypothetical protein